MRRSWRSPFWNTVTVMVFGSMALLTMMVVYDEIFVYQRWIVALVFSLGAIWCWMGAVRGPWVGVAATKRGILIRGHIGTSPPARKGRVGVALVECRDRCKPVGEVQVPSPSTAASR
jgi:hypothetical protein